MKVAPSAEVCTIYLDTTFSIITDRNIRRGLHDVYDELVFETNSRFVFHDSRGIESGTTNDIETIQSFITTWAGGRSLKDRLHAIW